MVADCQRHALATLPPEKIPVTHCTGRRVGPRAGWDGCEKSRPPTGFDSRIIQLVEYANRGRSFSGVAVLKGTLRLRSTEAQYGWLQY